MDHEQEPQERCFGLRDRGLPPEPVRCFASSPKYLSHNSAADPAAEPKAEPSAFKGACCFRIWGFRENSILALATKLRLR